MAYGLHIPPRARALLLCLGMMLGLGAVEAEAVGTRSVALSWDQSSDEVAGYRVYYGVTSGNYTDSVDVGTLSSVTLSTLLASRSYYFVVTAYDSGHIESEPSEEAYLPALRVELTSALPTAVLNENSNVLLTATLSAFPSEADGSLRVEFLSNDQIMGVTTEPPFQKIWNGAAPGTYRLVAVVSNQHGELLRSSVLAMTVVKFAIQQIEVLPQVGARLMITGAPGYRNRVYVSPDLVGWTLLTTADNENGTLWVDDPGAAQKHQRFYRVSADALY